MDELLTIDMDYGDELRFRHHADFDIVVIYLDWMTHGGHDVLVAVGVVSDGEKRILGIEYGKSGSVQTAQSLIANLIIRGVKTERRRLIITSGDPSLRNIIAGMFGQFSVIQRCRQVTLDDVSTALSVEAKASLEESMQRAFSLPGEKGLAIMQQAIDRIRADHPIVAANIEEGLRETLTINLLDLPPTLRKELGTTNLIRRLAKRWIEQNESLNGDAEARTVLDTVARVLLEAEPEFRRIMGFKDIWVLEAALADELVAPPENSEGFVFDVQDSEPVQRTQKWTEHRAHRRWNVVGVEGNIQCTTQARVLDISATGISVETTTPLKVGRDLQFKLRHVGREVDLTGRVMWCHLKKTQRNDDGDVVPIYGTGIAFECQLEHLDDNVEHFIETSIEIDLERRVYGRFTPNGETTEIEMETSFTFLVKRLSLSGMQMLTNQELAIESTLPVELKLGDERFGCLGRVVNTRKIDQASANLEIGLAFEKVDEENMAVLETFIAHEFDEE